MITFAKAVRATGFPVVFPFLFLLGFIVACVKPSAARKQRKPFKHGGLLFVSLVLFLVSLLAWVGPILAARFDWNRNDVSEIELTVFNSPYPLLHPEQTIQIKDAHAISLLFDGVETLEPGGSADHGHAVGTSYVLRLRRRSDGSWSRYRVIIYPDRETTAGTLKIAGVYETSIVSRSFNNGEYRGADLGRRLERIAGK